MEDQTVPEVSENTPQLPVPDQECFSLLNANHSTPPYAVRTYYLRTIDELTHRLEYAPENVANEYAGKIKGYKEAFALVYPWISSQQSEPEKNLHKSDAFAILGLKPGTARLKIRDRIRDITADLDRLEKSADQQILAAIGLERNLIARATVAIFPELESETNIRTESQSRAAIWIPKRWSKKLIFGVSVLLVGVAAIFGVKKFMEERGEKKELTIKKANRDLLKACKRGNVENLEEAIQAGADANCEDEKGVPAIMWAVYSGDMEVVEFLIEEGADCDPESGPMPVEGNGNYWETAWYGSTLVAAAGEGHMDIVEFLISDCGVDINKVDYNDEEDQNGMTAVIASASNGHEAIVKYLIPLKPNLETADADGRTALMLAVMHDNPDIAKILLKAGADFQAIDDEGKSVYDLADSYAMRTILEEFGADKFEYFNEFDKEDSRFAATSGADFGKEVSGGNLRMWQVSEGYCNDTYANFGIDKYEDFVLEAGVRWISGSNSTFGLIFGRDDDDNYYSFQVNASGEYELSKFEGGSKSPVIVKTFSALIHSGSEINSLRIQKEGYSLSLYINGEYEAYSYYYGSFGSQFGLSICNEGSAAFTFFKLTGDPD